MKILTAFINTLLVSFLVISGILFVINKVANAEYLNVTAEKSGVYKGISEVISRRLVETSAQNLGVSIDQIPAEASNIVSEEYITTKSQEVTDQIEEALRGERRSVMIDISDLAAKAQAAGLNVNANDLKPVEITVPGQDEAGNVRAAQNLNFFKFISYFVTISLLLASITLAIIRRNLTGLGVALLSSGVIFAVFALIGTLVAGTAADLIKFPETISEVTPHVQIFTRAIVDSAVKTFMVFAIILVPTGLSLLIINRKIKRQQTSQSTSEAPTSFSSN